MSTSKGISLFDEEFQKADRFTCSICHNSYVKGCTNEEAIEEYKQIFPDEALDKVVSIVCDECWKKYPELQEPLE